VEKFKTEELVSLNVMFFSSRDVKLGMDEAYLKVKSVDHTIKEFLVVSGVSDNCYKVSKYAFSF
jgi:hypothetical protein